MIEPTGLFCAKLSEIFNLETAIDDRPKWGIRAQGSLFPNNRVLRSAGEGLSTIKPLARASSYTGLLTGVTNPMQRLLDGF